MQEPARQDGVDRFSLGGSVRDRHELADLQLLVGQRCEPLRQFGFDPVAATIEAMAQGLALAARTGDPTARLESLQKAEAILLDEAPVIPLYFWTRVYLLAPSVQGWYPNRLDSHPYKYVWLKE